MFNSEALTDPDERACWVAWSLLPGLSGRHLLALVGGFGSLSRAWHAPAAAVTPYLPRDSKALEARGGRPLDAWRAVQREGQAIVLHGDAGFPAPLREIPDPPAVLYVRGRLPAWRHAVAVVGARRASAYGTRIARGLGRGLAGVGAVVVSGVAAGIDAQAHEGALEVPGGLTVGVLGCGLDHVYPAGHGRLYGAIAAHGALISEHPPMERPTRYSFPRRNRLISGLSQGVVVVEATAKSGSLGTAAFALEQGRAVCAVPGLVDMPGSEGPHALLRDGARLVAGVPDVLEELGWQLAPVPRPAAVSPAAERVLAALGQGPLGQDGLRAASGLGASALAAALLELELAGRVVRQPGARYALA